MKQGEIYLVNFPFSDISSTKKRPALLVGDIKGDNKIFIQISTKKKLTKNYQIELKKDESNGEVNFNSFLNCDMIFTLHKDLVLRKIADIHQNKFKEVQEKRINIISNNSKQY